MMFGEQAREGRPPQHPSQQLQLPLGRQNSETAARGSLQHTIQSARSSAFSQLTLQQPSASSSSTSSNNAHLNSPSPNSTPVKPNFAARAGLFERGLAAGAAGAAVAAGNHFDKLHLFDSSANASPIGSPKEGRRAGQGPQRTSSVRELGSAFSRAHQQHQQPPHMRARSNVPSSVALSWPSEVSMTAGAQRQRDSAGGPHVRQSLPLLSPAASSGHNGAGGGGGGGRNFPTLRGAQLIEEAPPVLSPELAHELQLDDYGEEDISFGSPGAYDDDEYDDVEGELDAFGLHRHRAVPRPDFSPAAMAVHAASEHDSASVTAAPAARGNGGDKPASRAASGRSRSAKKTSASAASAAAAGLKKLDLSTAQTMRSPYARNAFSKGTKAKAAAAGGAHGVLPAEEWVASESDDEDEGHFGGGGNGGDDDGWLLDVGMAEDANPRFRQSMEDAHVIRRRIGPPLHIARGSGAGAGELENKESPSAPLFGSLFCVFDGHGGRATVDFLARHFHRAWSRKLSDLGGSGRGGPGAAVAALPSSDVSRALESTFLHVDAAMATQETRDRVFGTQFQDCGSTACVAYLRPVTTGSGSAAARNVARELFLANVGDAAAVLAVDKKELQRVSAAGGAGTSKKSKRGSNSAANRPVSPTSRGGAGGADPDGLAPTERQSKKSGTHKKSGSSSRASSAAPEPPLAKTLARGTSLASTTRVPAKLTAMPLSYAHVASDAKEAARIKAAGGCVFAGRVGGCLAVSRAFGDYALKPGGGVSCVPHQQHVLLTSAHKFLIIGCDGIWDVMDAQTAVDAVAALRDAQQMADKLVALALKRGTTDNVSCMVVRFQEN